MIIISGAMPCFKPDSCTRKAKRSRRPFASPSTAGLGLTDSCRPGKKRAFDPSLTSYGSNSTVPAKATPAVTTRLAFCSQRPPVPASKTSARRAAVALHRQHPSSDREARRRDYASHEAFSLPGDIILDPFAGLGTTGVAARSCGRHFILIETVLCYYKTARARLAH